MAYQARRTGWRAGVLAMGLALTAMAAPARAETLADALISAYRQSNLLEQNRAVLRATDEDVAGAIAALRPVFAFVADSGYARTVQTSGYSASIGLSASLSLFDSGRSRLSVLIAQETVLATREALVQVEQGVLLDAVSAYFDVRSALESVAINENSVRVIGEELRAAEDRFEVGEVTRTDVALAEAQLAAARASAAAASGSLSVAREAYKAATGHYPATLAPAPPTPALPATLEEAKAIALRTHPSVREAQRQVTVSELQVRLAAAQRGPNVDASVQAGRNDNGQDTMSAGVSMSQTLYSGGSLSSLHRQAIASRDSSRAALLQAGVTIGQSVGEAWSNIAVARAQISATEEQIRAATAAYEGVREEANLGARTTLDVLDAEQDLLDARASRIDAEASLQVSIYSLLASMGLLTAEHLNLGIPTYDPAAYYEAVKNAPPTSTQGKSLDRVLRAIGKE
ncbi:TolC family outer membrane protein [Frigidibacter albus]|uniref:Type I secretion outer membrane protein, TolC family n=2 Tax=Frigidibacter mobilis TaxID=1335048 RepID=A0A159Z5W8_9RHOB|nr:type I secretion outer membrane protein, TolC family [Frigidibacter mobilis]